MEFSIDIHNSLQGDITLEDFSKEYGYYIPEGDDYPDSKIEEIDGVSTLKYKYSKTVTLNTILKVNMEEAILQDVLIHKHEDDMDYELYATRTMGCTGADISTIVNNAAISAVDDDRDKISNDDVLKEIDKVLMFDDSENSLEKKKNAIGFI